MSAVDLVLPQPSPSRQLHKFGGSSLADPNCFRRVAHILKQCSGERDLIVVSAAGKTTNRLIDWLSLLEKNALLADDTLRSLHDYQTDLIENLIEGEPQKFLIQALNDDIKAIAQQGIALLDVATRAWVQGFGEVWSARLLAALLSQLKMPSVTFDSRSFLRAERSVLPEVDCVISLPLLMEKLAEHPQNRIVITGFMAQNQQGETVLLGRNGSDYSATVIGVMADVSGVTIWSDVAGVYSADPRLVTDASLLPLLRLDEAAELARLAAPVLHGRTLQPIAQSSVALNFRCSYAPNQGSTRIERVLSSGRGAKIITALDDVCLLVLDVAPSDNFAEIRSDIERLLTRKQLLPLAAMINEEQGQIQLAYSAEIAASMRDELQSAAIPIDINLAEGYSMIAAVGAGVATNLAHCDVFYQQLRQQPIAFICTSGCGLSIAAIFPRANTAALVVNIHRELFAVKPSMGLVAAG